MFKREIPAYVNLEQFAADMKRAADEARTIQKRLAAGYARRKADRQKHQTGDREARRG